MIPMSKHALMGGTVAAAVGIGFFMQNSPTAQARYGEGVEVASLTQTLPAAVLADTVAKAASDENTPALDDAVLAPVPRAQAAPDTDAADTDAPDSDAPDPGATAMLPQDAPPAPTDPAPAPMDMASAGSGPDQMLPDTEAASALAAPDAQCEPRMTAIPQDAAMVDLALASCQPQARVTIHHNGMMVQGITDAGGALQITLPALAEVALFIAEFQDRQGAVATVTVPTLADYDRVVLQWRGDEGFLLNAFEFDAAYGQEGHRYRDTPGTIEAAALGSGGVVTQHGDAAVDNGLLAEAYTFARSTAQRVGKIAFSVEAVVTEANCGREIAAQSLQVSGGTGLAVRELVLTMPDCSAVGDYIVLNNMAEDLIIAAN